MKTVFKLIIFLSFFNSLLFSQEAIPVMKNELRMELFPLVFNRLKINYERYNDNFGNVFTCGLIRLEEINKDISGYVFQYGPRIYILSHESIKYLNTKSTAYFTPVLLYRNIIYESEEYKDKITTYGLCLVAGIKYIIHERFVIDFNGGARYFESNIKSDNQGRYKFDVFSPGFTGISFIVNCSIGFKF